MLALILSFQCRRHLNLSFVQCVDESDGCGAKLVLTVVSDDDFEKVPLLQRHRKVQKILKDAGYMDQIHALTIRAWTVKQWEAKKST